MTNWWSLSGGELLVPLVMMIDQWLERASWKAQLFSADCGLFQSPPHWKAQFHAKWNLFQSDSNYDIIFSWNLWLVAHVYSILYVSCPGSPIISFPSWNRQILPGSNSPRTQWSYPWPKKNSQGAVAERGSARQRAAWRQRGGGVWLRMVEKPGFNGWHVCEFLGV